MSWKINLQTAWGFFYRREKEKMYIYFFLFICGIKTFMTIRKKLIVSKRVVCKTIFSSNVSFREMMYWQHFRYFPWPISRSGQNVRDLIATMIGYFSRQALNLKCLYGKIIFATFCRIANLPFHNLSHNPIKAFTVIRKYNKTKYNKSNV